MILPASVGCAARSVPPVLLSIAGACAVGIGSVGLVSIPPVEVPISGTLPMTTGTVGLVATEQATIMINGALPMTAGTVGLTTDAIFDVTGVLPMTTGTVGLEAIAPATITINGTLPMTTGTVGLTATVTGIPYANKMLWIIGDNGLTDQGQYGYTYNSSVNITSGSTYNGHASLHGDGSSSLVRYDAKTNVNAALNSGVYSIILVYKSVSNDNGVAISWNNSATNDNYRTIQPDSVFNSNKPRAYFTTNGGGVQSINHTNASTTGTLRVYSVRVTGGTGYMSIDGNAEESTTVTTSTDTDTFTLFSIVRPANPSGVNFDNGDLCELIISDTADSTKISEEITALKTKYGIS